MAYNTGNPIGSTDPRDAADNKENFDKFALSTDPTYLDRLGVARKTWAGMEQDFQQFLINSGYQFLGDYTAGIEVTDYNQVIRDGGEFWRLSGSVTLPYTTTGAGLPDGGAFVAVGDAVLRQELADPSKGAAMVGFKQEGAGAVSRTLADKAGEWVSVKDYGSNGSPLEDSIHSAALSTKRINIPEGDYPINLHLVLTGKDGVSIEGIKENTKVSGNPNTNIINFYESDNISLRGISLDCQHTVKADSGHGIVARDSNNVLIQDVNVEGIGGTGSGVIQYNSNGEPASHGVVFDNITVKGNRSIEENTNGVLQSDSYWGRISNIYAEGIGQFPAEFKNDCRYSLLSDVQINDCRTGLYHGHTANGYPSYIASSNVIVKGADFGVTTGNGDHNIYSNILVDLDGAAFSRPEGARFNGSNSAIWGLLVKGGNSLSNSRGVHFKSTAEANYVSIAAHNSVGSLVSVDPGAKKNVIEVSHPGVATSLLASPVISGKANVFGVNGNPVFSPALGEFLGNLSGSWKFVDSEAGHNANIFSSDIFRIESNRPSFNIAAKAAAGSSSSFAVATPNNRASLTWSDSSTRWQFGAGAWSYRLTPNRFHHSIDNTASLGSASARWTAVYVSSGSISTSDRREKQQVRDITESEKAVALQLKTMIRAFKFNEAVEKKGEKARWHFGVMAQEVAQVFADNGLDAHDYALFCYDEWDETPEITEPVLDDEGNETGEFEIIQEYRPAGNRYGIRYDQLLAFIIGAL